MKKKILIFGYGSIGKKHKYIISRYFKNFEITISSKHLKKNLKFKEKFFFGCLICSAATFHLQDLKKALKICKNILIEKPLFSNPIKEETKKFIFSLIKKNKINLQVGYCLRFHPAIEFIKKNVLNKLNSIDRIEVYTSTYLPFWRKGDYRKQISASRSHGGGVLNELSHEIDLLSYLFGNISLKFSNIFNSKNLEINTEDHSNIIFGSRKCSNIFMHLDFSTRSEKREIKIFSKNIVVFIDLVKNNLLIKKNKKLIKKKFNLNKDFIYREQFKYFINNSNKKNRIYKDFNDSLKTVELIYKIRRFKK